MKNENNFRAIYLKYAKPMIIRSVFNSFMHTADRMIAALFIGSSALVATTLASPLMYLTYAIAAIFIGGLGAYVGLLLGQNRIDEANNISSGIIMLLTIIGVLMTLPVFFLSTPIAKFLGASADMLVMTGTYIKVFSLSFPFTLMGRSLDVLICNDDSPKFSFVVNVIVTTMNLGLNIMAIAVFDLGILGLAGATVISNVFQVVAGLYYFLFESVTIKFTKPVFYLKKVLRICYNGLSDFSMLIVDAVMVFIVNMAFTKFLSPAHFEAYAAANLLMVMFYGIFMGTTMGLQPVLSRAMGENRFEFLEGLLNYGIKKSMILGFLAYVIFIPFANGILGLFVDQGTTHELAMSFYLTLGFAVMFSNYPLQLSIFFTAINRPLESAVISVLRTLILIPLFAYLGIMMFGANGLSLGFILADVILIMLLLVYMKRIDISKLIILE